MEDVADETKGEKEKVLLKFGVKVALGTLGVGVSTGGGY